MGKVTLIVKGLVTNRIKGTRAVFAVLSISPTAVLGYFTISAGIAVAEIFFFLGRR